MQKCNGEIWRKSRKNVPYRIFSFGYLPYSWNLYSLKIIRKWTVGAARVYIISSSISVTYLLWIFLGGPLRSIFRASSRHYFFSTYIGDCNSYGFSWSRTNQHGGKWKIWNFKIRTTLLRMKLKCQID